MELIKSFYRKRTTKSYFAILSIMILGIISIFSFVNYYSDIFNENFIKSTYILFVSEKDTYETLKNKSYVNEIVEGIIATPDYTDKLIRKSESSSTNTISEKSSGENNTFENEYLYWEEFLIDEKNTLLTTIKKEENIIINDNELIFYLPLQDRPENELKYIESLKGKKIKLSFYNKKSQEFIIKDFIENEKSQLKISQELFQKIKDNDNELFAYQIKINDYKEVYNARRDLNQLDHHDDFNITINYASVSDFNEGEISNLINKLSLIANIILIIMLIIMFIIFKSIIKDDNNNIHILRLLGYKKGAIIKQTVINIFLLIFITILISIIFSIVLIGIINNIYNINLTIFNLANIAKLSIAIVIIVTMIIIFNILKLKS